MTTAHTNARLNRLVLAVLGLAQLMVVLDVTVVNIALPSAQQTLGFSDGDRQWIVTAYTLAFGGLLLLSGRLSDLVGRRRILITGLLGFAAASALGGAAQTFSLLVAARALQGVFGALLAPAALSLVATIFTESTERRRAFGTFGAIGIGGGAVGLLLGGVLTQYLSWRWCMLINIPIAVVAVTGALNLLPADPAERERPRLDIPGTLTGCAGLVALVYGFSQAERSGWTGVATLGFISLGIALLAVFTVLQRRVAHPLLPLRVVLDRQRGAAFLALGVNTASLLAVFLFLTYYLQQNLGMSPVVTGLAFLPAPVATTIASMQAAGRLATRFGQSRVIVAGMLLAAVGMALLAQLDAHSSYALSVVPGLVMMSFGLGCVTGLAMGAATNGVEHADTGVASAAVSTMQQVGGSLGTAVLSTLAVSATQHALQGGPRTSALTLAASAHGYTNAFWTSAALLAIGAAVTGLLLRGTSQAALPFAAENEPQPLLAH